MEAVSLSTIAGAGVAERPRGGQGRGMHNDGPSDASRPVLGERFAGDLLRAARRVADLSQRQLAGALNVSHTVVARIESGVRQPRFITMLQLLRAAGCTVEFRGPGGEDLLAVPKEARRMRDGRHFPAHLDAYDTNGALTWWTWRWAVPPPGMPISSFRLDRERRDRRRRGQMPESYRWPKGMGPH